MFDLKKLLERRVQLVAEGRQIIDKARSENRDLTAEEDANWKRCTVDVQRIKDDVDREERQRIVESELVKPIGEAIENRESKTEGDEKRAIKTGRIQATEKYHDTFLRFLVRGPGAVNGDEFRALQADSDEAGGYLYASEMFVNRLIKAVDNLVFLRQWGTVMSVTSSDSLGFPSLDADPADADWTTELQTGSEDSTMDFGKRAMTPHPLAKRIKVSRKLLQKTPSVEELIVSRLGYKFGVTMEKAFLTGTGAQQPLGIFTASANGINTDRDVSTGNTTTSVTFNGLKTAKWTLKQQYLNRSRWLFHRDAGAQIDKLVDGQGQYLWQVSTQVGSPDTLFGRPCFFSEYAPNTFTTGLYVGMIADFSYYWVADALSMQMQRLEELYAETNQVGFIGRLESDGMPVLSEAFVRVKLA